MDFWPCVAKCPNFYYKLVQPIENGISACPSNTTKDVLRPDVCAPGSDVSSGQRGLDAQSMTQQKSGQMNSTLCN